MTFTLITNAYDERDLHRLAEYKLCLERNLALGHIERVILVYEDKNLFVAGVHPKLTVEHLGYRGTFGQYFSLANQLPSGSRVILSNADIYFDDTLELAGRIFDREPRTLACLSRYDELPDGTLKMVDIGDSHDAWLFQTPFVLDGAAFTLGVPGCDGRIAWLADRAGIPLTNPARSVRARHVHKSGVRHYNENERVRGAYHWVMAT